MNEQPLSRRDRIARVRMRVVAGAAALFIALFGGVVLAGRQPATKTAAAATPSSGSAATPTSTQTYSDDGSSSSDDGSGYSDDGSGYSNNSSGSSSTYSAPAPMTTRSS